MLRPLAAKRAFLIPAPRDLPAAIGVSAPVVVSAAYRELSFAETNFHTRSLASSKDQSSGYQVSWWPPTSSCGAAVPAASTT